MTPQPRPSHARLVAAWRILLAVPTEAERGEAIEESTGASLVIVNTDRGAVCETALGGAESTTD